MSTIEANPVILGTGQTFAGNGINDVVGPIVFYKLPPGSPARIESVTFKVVTQILLSWDLAFKLSLVDQSGLLLFQQITPLFNTD